MKVCTLDGCGKPHVAKGLCRNHYNLEWSAANPEKVRSIQTTWRNANREVANASLRAARRAADPVEAAAARRSRREANIEAARLASRKWWASNGKALMARRRAAKRNQFVADVSRDDVMARDAGRCHLCLNLVDPANWHLDHVIPLHLGGPHEARNLAVAHPRCNLSKRAKACSAVDARWTEALVAFEEFHGIPFTSTFDPEATLVRA